MIHYFEKHKDYLDKPLTKEGVNDILYYCEKGFFLQLLKEFGIVHLLIVLNYLQEIENYVDCGIIISTINDSNKHFGTNFKTSLEDYAQVS